VLLELKELDRIRSYDVGFAAEEYLAVSLAMDAPPGADADSATMAAHRTRFATVLETLRQRVAAEPGVVGVTFVDKLPRMDGGYRSIALDDSASVAALSAAAGAPGLAPPRPSARIAFVDPSYFDVL